MKTLLPEGNFKMAWKLSDQGKLLISMAGAALNEGETDRALDCPECFGGQHHEKAFSLTRKGTVLLFKCFRAGCGIEGLVAVHGNLLDLPKQEDLEKKRGIERGRPFIGVLDRCPDLIYRQLRESYGILAEEVLNNNIRYATGSKRIAFGVRSVSGITRGYMLRDYNANSGFPKWDAYPNIGYAATAWLSWHTSFATHTSKGPIVVVEDQLSAIRVARNYRAVALLGTHIDLDRIMEIAEQSTKADNCEVILALDKDATSKAIDWLREWSFFTGDRFRAVAIERDLKFESEKAINDIIRGAV